MVRRKLDETLAELHEQLTGANDLSTEQIELLRAAIQEIEAAIREPSGDNLPSGDVGGSSEPSEGDADQSMADRLRRIMTQLEHSHPTITATVGRIADLLSQLGI